MLTRGRRVLFVLAGMAGLLLRDRYTGPFQEVVHGQGGNVAASFAVYFILANLPFPPTLARWWTAAAALAVVELFEATDGFGVMTNVHDPLDYAANAAGIALALAIDRLTGGAGRGGGPGAMKRERPE